MPKIRIVGTPEKIEKSNGSRVTIAPPLDYDKLMKTIPYGKLITNDKIKGYLAVSSFEKVDLTVMRDITCQRLVEKLRTITRIFRCSDAALAMKKR
jgi:hypothetical protein